MSSYGFEKDEVLEKINESAHRASKQINDLLDLNNISKPTEEMSEVNLDNCVDKIKVELEQVIAEKHADITYSSLGTIKGIPWQIEQLMNNLIENVLKFSQGQNSHIAISLSNSTPQEIEENTPLNPQQEYVCLKIEDDGIGFEQKFAGQIFAVFNRLNNRNAYEGNGIGLAIGKKIADNHNGHIMAKSQKGEGATFYVYLPK